uniref:(northern house mosquito) hypothetical protein n=1 Tax=Culex pipiens TaxID=7175 RepID=A0A8D8MNB4_CULPI
MPIATPAAKAHTNTCRSFSLQPDSSPIRLVYHFLAFLDFCFSASSAWFSLRSTKRSALSAQLGPCPVTASSTLSVTLSTFLLILFQSIVMYPCWLAICSRMMPPPTATAAALPTFIVM